ncbi:hypothetical protein OOK31_00280 [Streptomyces sp. NBC_00249]|nr:hypothetical protein [Streptomyces sp. NBC_00249]MCX5192339.1 hypothetical protein [Streptomyces sp. NBC_00249]
MPAVLDSSISGARSASVGWGGSGRARSAWERGAQHAEDLLEVLHGLVGAGADDADGLGHLLGRGAGIHLQGPGVHAQQGQPVGEHVVHLAGQRFALALSDLIRAQKGLRPGLLAAVVQAAQEPSPAHGAADQHAAGHRGGQRGGGEVRLEGQVQGQREQGHGGDGAGGRGGTHRGDGEQGGQCGGDERRHRGQDGQDQRHGHWPPPAPQQQRAAGQRNHAVVGEAREVHG